LMRNWNIHPNPPTADLHTPIPLVDKYGKKEVEKMPLGAIGIYTYAQKFKVGLQQLMAGARKFKLSEITRNDVMALTEEAAKISGIAYVMDAYKDEAEKILNE